MNKLLKILSGVLVLVLFLVADNTLAYSGNPALVGPFSEAGDVRIYTNSAADHRIEASGNGQFSSFDGNSGRIWDTGISVEQGDYIRLDFTETAIVNGPFVGWTDPRSGNICGKYPYPDWNVSSYINWAEGYGEDIVSKQCWADAMDLRGGEDNDNYDFNDLFVMVSYTPGSHPAEPTVDIKANGSDGAVTVNYDSDVELTWDSTNADSCQAYSDWSGSKPVDGSEMRYDLWNDKTYRIECTGPGGTATDRVYVEAQKTLSVRLTANPSNGDASLNDVDLTADVYGTANGTITYHFDCENDGSWDRTVSSYSEDKTVYDLCDYDSFGDYTAKVWVERDGEDAYDTDSIYVSDSNETLYVNLTADPDNGDAPLNNVDLKASVSGSANGEIEYRFNCENDGSWDRTTDSYSEDKTIDNLCDYDSAGTYTARVRVWRDGLTATDTDRVNVTGVAGVVSPAADKEVRNLSDGNTVWKETEEADYGEMVLYRIEIEASEDLADVYFKDELGEWAKWYDDVVIDDVNFSDDDMTDGVFIGDIDEGQTVVITFKVLLEGKNYFDYGATEITNSAMVYNDDFEVSDTAVLEVKRSSVAGATSVATGVLSDSILALGITILVSYILMVVYFIIKRVSDGELDLSGKVDYVHLLLPWRTETKSRLKLHRKVERIRGK